MFVRVAHVLTNAEKSITFIEPFAVLYYHLMKATSYDSRAQKASLTLCKSSITRFSVVQIALVKPLYEDRLSVIIVLAMCYFMITSKSCLIT